MTQLTPQQAIALVSRKRGRGRVGGRKTGMNRTEARYAQTLEARKQAGQIVGYWFERIRFVLAPKTSYTPDFMVMLADGTIEYHEVKGYWEDDARAKIKIAADMFPFRFVAVMDKGKSKPWVYEVIGENEEYKP